jgi:hypothetical protein
MTLAAMVARGVLLPREASDLVSEAASFLEADVESPEIRALYQEAYRTIAEDLAQARPGTPLPRPSGRPPLPRSLG